METISFDDLPQRRIKPLEKRERRHKGKFDHAQFIAWDGEGITSSTGHHSYILFASSTGDYVTTKLEAVTDGLPVLPGISTRSALATLIRVGAANPRAIHVIYYGSYDYNMLLQDISRAILERLRRGERAYWRQYNLEVRFGKRLWVEDRELGISVTLWDVGSFFQQSFVKSLRTWQVPLRPGVLENIEHQKTQRAVFKADDFAAIKEYCFQELNALVLLMQQFRDALEVCGLRISQWHGPGAIAGKLYDIHAIKSHKQVCPIEINRAAQYAYGGGRIELVRQGHFEGDIYNYDVRSCYPAAIANLPSLSNANWQHYQSPTEPDIRELSLYRLRWNFRKGESFYPLRNRRSDGSVSYPRSGADTWVWTPEYKLCQDYFPGEFKVIEAYIFNVTHPTYPFRWVEEMYYQRAEWKRKGYGAERILKLGLNSLYGKMIQQIGWKAADQLPAYHQLEWGGYVTSCGRASLFDASYGNRDVIGFETDGIFTTSPLSVELSNELGGWELSTHQRITYVQVGFYWLDDKVRYRGFDPGSVTEDMVLNGWRNEQQYVKAQLTRHVGLNFAAHTGHWEDWGNWLTTDRNLDIGSASTKRLRICGPKNCRACANRKPSLADALHDTEPYPDMIMEASFPYPLAWRPEGLPEWKRELIERNKQLGDFECLRYG